LIFLSDARFFIAVKLIFGRPFYCATRLDIDLVLRETIGDKSSAARDIRRNELQTKRRGA